MYWIVIYDDRLLLAAVMRVLTDPKLSGIQGLVAGVDLELNYLVGLGWVQCRARTWINRADVRM